MKNFDLLKKKLEKIKLPQWKYAIFWSWPITIRGIRDCKDLDVIVKDDIYKKLCKQYPNNIKKKPVNRIQIENIEIGNMWIDDKSKITEMIDTAEIIEWLPFVRIEYFKEWKKKMWREKDKKDLELLNEYEKNVV